MLLLRSRVGPRGQTVIPKPIRDALGLHAGDEVLLHVDGGKVVLEPATRPDALDRLLALGPNRKAPSRIDWKKELYERYE